MAQLKLTYFDFHGGRAEPARLAFHLGGIAFEDHRFAREEFAEVRKTTPFGQVPVLWVDGVAVTQSDAIARYAGKLAGLYPVDPLQAMLCDEVTQALEDAGMKMGPTYAMSGDAQKQARTALVDACITPTLRWLAAQLAAHGGQYLADGRLTIADLKAMVYVHGLNSGRLDHVPADLVARVAPELNAYAARIGQTPGIVQYYAKFAA